MACLIPPGANMSVMGFNFDDAFSYENGFYLTSQGSRLGKLLAHYEVYKMIKDLPGDIVEFGVFKGASFVRWVTFRDLFESPMSRRVVGFDSFAEFPLTNHEADSIDREKFIKEAGERSISVEELESVLEHKQSANYELVRGNILETLPRWLVNNKKTRFSLIHIDTDVYEPAQLILEKMYELLVPGGIFLFDDYTSFLGETEAVDEFLKKHPGLKLRKFPFSHKIPSFLVKQ